MQEVHVVEKRAKLALWKIVKFQLVTYCYIKDIVLSDSEMNCITLLAIKGELEVGVFCNHAYTDGIFKSDQTVRNCLTKLEKLGFIIKTGKYKKLIRVDEALKLTAAGNILLDFKLAYIDTQKA